MDTVIVSNSQFYSHFPRQIPKGSVNAEQVEIRLDKSWDGLTVFWHWKNLGTGVEKRDLLKDPASPHDIPWEVLTDLGELRMGLVGMDGDTVIKPTIWLSYGYVSDGVDPESGSDPQPPTPSWEQQMVEQATQANQAAQAAQQAAEEAAKAVASAGPYAEQAKQSAEAAKASQDAAATSARQANEAAQTAQNAAGSIGDAVKRAEDAATAAGTAQQAAETAQGAAARSAETAQGAATTANQAAQESNSAATKAGQYLTSVESAAQAAASARDQATTAATTAQGAAQAAASARDQANTAATTAQGHASAATTAKDAAEQAATNAGNAQAGADQSAKTAASSASAAQAAQQAAEEAAAVLPKPTPEDAGKVPMVNPEGTGYVFGEAGGGKIDDTTLGRDTTWSSRMIVDSLAPSFEISGPVVTCNPVSGYPLSVVSQIVAVQSGAGDPSPENVRPISGWDSVSVRITGVNLWDNNADSAIVEEYPSGNGYLAFPLKLKPNANYTLYIPKNTRGSSNITLTTEERQNNSPKDEFYINLSGTELFIEGYKKIRTGETGYVFINVSSRTKDQFWKGLRETVPQLMIYEGADEIPYEPYAGKTVTSQLGQTIYGGTLNWMTGELTVTHICADIKSTDAWGDSIAVNGYILNKDFGIAEGGAVLCNIAPVSDYGGAGALTASVAYGYVRMSDFKTLFPTIEEWRGFLDEIGGVQVCGKLKTPTTVKLTPTEILALTDTNTLYTDTGDITVSGRADPNEVIKGLEDRIAALQGGGGGTMDAQQVLFSRALAATCTTFSDAQALSMPDILPTWQEFLDRKMDIPSGVCLMHDGQCYRQAQSTPIKPEAQRPPGSPGMSAVYRPIVSGHAGTLDDPIPWVYEMDCEAGKYYSHKGKIYLCTGDMAPCVWEPGGGAPQWEVAA